MCTQAHLGFAVHHHYHHHHHFRFIIKLTLAT